MGNAADFLIGELRAARVRRGLNQDDLGKMINYSGSHVSAVETGQRAPKPEYVAALDEALDTGGIFTRLLERLASLDSAPPWLREWIEIEREASSLRWFEPAWVPGLLQTEAYARATLAGELLTAEEVEKLVASRLGRQEVLSRERPPLLVVVLDEAVLRRHVYHDAGLMAAQLEHLARCAELPNVQVHVVPADTGMYPGFGGGFIIAETPDGGRVAHADGQLAAQIVDRADDIAMLECRWERIRGDALSRQQSLELIRKAATSWT
ncbi:Helix-turn-helix domain-containing protein [Micromonospora pattaloongensis]|uniref:Helix-turn-helix domain-containing protein n=1 Tax=Micromonospora pattaloongensis TaxID=405436 RepID=A0A1H3FH27_9ACTN|nr:helix-turn-helix transcriptional regulator [Micromonospora pattaloongensis]SDX90342.1 Helix-turn-helix domain-containing protein [Micromonospora pattaloongensis]